MPTFLKANHSLPNLKRNQMDKISTLKASRKKEMNQAATLNETTFNKIKKTFKSSALMERKKFIKKSEAVFDDSDNEEDLNDTLPEIKSQDLL